jgi:hypothetical protein
MLMHDAAPLRGLSVRPQAWQVLLDELAAHAAGKQSATEFLHGMTGRLDPPVARALITYLSLPAADAAYVAEELRKA